VYYQTGRRKDIDLSSKQVRESVSLLITVPTVQVSDTTGDAMQINCWYHNKKITKWES